MQSRPERGLASTTVDRAYTHIYGDGMATRSPRTCSVTGCGRTHAARGWCKSHHQRWQKHGDVLANVPIRAYASSMRATTCSVDDCERTPAAHGWCKSHYDRWLRSGDVRADLTIGFKTPEGECSREDCDSAAAWKGLCKRHYDTESKRRRRAQGTRIRRALYPGGPYRDCDVDDCDREHYAHGWREGHYQRWMRNGDVRADVPLRTLARAA